MNTLCACNFLKQAAAAAARQAAMDAAAQARSDLDALADEFEALDSLANEIYGIFFQFLHSHL